MPNPREPRRIGVRWPWRGRGRHAAGRVVFIGTSPFDVAETVAAGVAAAAAAAVPEQPPSPSVELGFADGSTLALADDDPRAVALRTVAALLTTKD
jgi:hypothetical protein